jgi:hypothetical protein
MMTFSPMMTLSRAMAEHTGKVFAVNLGAMLLLTIGAFLNGNLNQSDWDDRVWVATGTTMAKQFDALEQATKLTDSVTNETNKERREATTEFSMIMLYDSTSDQSIFNPVALQEICKFESIFVNSSVYPDFCILDDSGNCVPQASSIVTYFYGPNARCERLSDAHVENKTAELYTLGLSEEYKLQYGFFLGSDVLTNDPTYTQRTKSLIAFGGPLEGYHSVDDREGSQFSDFSDGFCEKIEKALFDHFDLKGNFFASHYVHTASRSGVKFRWHSECFQLIEWQRLISYDFSWVVLSLIFVFVWVRVHTQSTFITTMGMTQIVLSMTVGTFIYGTVFGIGYFHFLHLLIIFLVLGIGADDIFVYTDAWRQSADEFSSGDPKALRLARTHYALSRTAEAVFNTSFTTTVAFLSQTGSELMPIRSLGIYASIVVILNYVFAITFTPVVVLVAEDYFHGCGCKKSKAVSSQPTVVDDAGKVESQSGLEMAPRSSTPEESTEKATRSTSLASVDRHHLEVKNEATNPSLVDRVLHRYYVGPFLKQFDIAGKPFKLISFLSMMLMLAYAIQGIYFALQLSPPNEQEQWFPDEHMWTGFADDARDNYLSQSDDGYVEMDVVFGIDSIDRSGFNFWEPSKNLGTPIFDQDFVLHTASTQAALFDTCNTLRSYPCPHSGCDASTLAWPDKIECFIEPFAEWLNETHSIVLPTDLPSSDFVSYLNEFRVATSTHINDIGVIDGQLKFVRLTFLSSLPGSAGYDAMKPVVSQVDQLADDLRDASPPELASVFVSGGQRFLVWQAQGFMIANLIQGIMICSPVVFILLILTTRNVQISAFALLTVLSIVGSVLGLAQLLGWPLGIAESIAGVLVIGFSVDYTIHLGHMYMEASLEGHETRDERFRFAMFTMGSTVVANSITTFGAGVFMFGTQLVFFQKMAVLISGTIAFSFAFSFLFFMAQCAFMGPEKKFASIDFAKCTPNRCLSD